jgi:DNA/RNA endonuclease G (NUC1)
MRFSLSRTRPAAWLAAAVLLVSCTSSIDSIVSPQMRVPGPSFLEGGTVPNMAITEFIGNPTGTDDPFEWFEVWNGSGTTVNMKGMVFSSFGGSGETGFTVNTDMLVPDGAYALFVRSTQGPAPAGVERYAYGAGISTDKFILNNSETDWVTIKTSTGELVDSLAYNVRTNGVPATTYQPGSSANNGVARAKRKPIRDCSVASEIKAWGNAVTTIPGRTDKGTPGVPNDVADYTYTGTCGVVVPPSIGPLDHVTMAGATSVVLNGTGTVTASAEDAENDRITTAIFTWTSSDESIATVSAGVVTGKKVGGPVTITATTTVDGITKSGTRLVTVTEPSSGATFSIVTRSAAEFNLPVGFQDQLFASRSGPTIPATWESLNPTVATIDQRGIVTALAPGSVTFKATAIDDGTSRTTTLVIEQGTTGNAALYGDNALLGKPSAGGSDNDLLITRSQYTLSYNKSRGGPNWVAYHLNKENRGNLPGVRCNCFSLDPAVTGPGEVGLTTADYTGSGFDRGHMVRSNDRELGTRDQAATYYLSNILPQYANQNQGRWGDLESYLQTVTEGPTLPEVYILAGGRGEAGRIAGGRIAVPTHTWKVAIVLKSGATLASIDDPSDIVDLIAVDMPNVQNSPRDGNWQASHVTVDALEAATGYDVLALLNDYVENIIESGDRRPSASYTGATSALEGATLNFTSTSTDADVAAGSLGDKLSYQWSINGAPKSIEPAITATFPHDGSYQVQLIVSDIFGWADTVTKAITIANVAPDIAAFAGATLLEGERYSASGTFADPGDDSWTATVNYGDGSGDRSLALSGKSFTLGHEYASEGTFTVTVRINDGLATSVRTATVMVQTAAEGVRELIDMLGNVTSLSSGERNSLRVKLAAAERKLARMEEKLEGTELLNSFVNELQAMVSSGRLSESEAAPLIAYAERVSTSAGR